MKGWAWDSCQFSEQFVEGDAPHVAFGTPVATSCDATVGDLEARCLAEGEASSGSKAQRVLRTTGFGAVRFSSAAPRVQRVERYPGGLVQVLRRIEVRGR